MPSASVPKRLGFFFLVLEYVDMCVCVSNYHTYRAPTSIITAVFIHDPSISVLARTYTGMVNNKTSSAIPTLSTIRKESFWFPQRELLSHCAEMGRQMNNISSMDATMCSRAATVVMGIKWRDQQG